MSSAITYIVLGTANFFASHQPAPNATLIAPDISSTLRGPVQDRTGRYNYTFTPGVGAYRVPPGTTTWNAARRICEEQGGYLAIINSVAEAKAIHQVVEESNSEHGWIGVHDLYEENEFVTIHGESLAQTGYDAWNTGEPNGEKNENCVVLRFDEKLADVRCAQRYSPICELSIAHE